MVVVCYLRAMVAIFGDIVRDCGRIEAVGFQPPSTQQGLRVRHLEDPRPRCAFRAIKHRAFPVNVEKHFLYEVIRLSFIAKYSLTNIPDRTSITSEEQSQGIAAAPLNIRDQNFICSFT